MFTESYIRANQQINEKCTSNQLHISLIWDNQTIFSLFQEKFSF